MEFYIGLTERENEVIEMMRNGENHLHPIYLSKDKDKYALCITVVGDRVKADYVIGQLFRDPDIIRMLKTVGGFTIHGVSLIDPCTDMDHIQQDIDKVMEDHPELQKYRTEIDEALAKNHILRAFDPGFDAPPPGYAGHESRFDKIRNRLVLCQNDIDKSDSVDDCRRLYRECMDDLQNLLED